MTYGPVAAAALLGAASIPHCMGMCGPIAGACGSSRGASASYQAARLATYVGLGALASRLASPLRDALPQGLSAYLLAAIMAAALLTSALRLFRTAGSGAPDVPVARLVRPGRGSALMPIGLGMVTGLLPCGTLYGALAVAAAAPSSATGALTMLAFGSVSALGLLVSHAATRLLASDATGRGRRLVAGVLVIGAALALLRPLVTGTDGSAPCHDGAPRVASATAHGVLP